MVKVKYIPEPGTPDETETLNHKFSARRATEVTDEAVVAVLRGNPFFQVMDDEKGSKVPTPAPKTVPVILIASEQEDGTFAIMNGADLIKEGLTKEDADAFNALSDEDKAEYVAA
ncbi:hypothetical protein [Rhizobium rhizogenes]|uniref:hypothetical protein n=1 Tax=Rhizobium rhizogenes TaxID=359 RepID=UPI00227176F1|nr:hypothetical protein [Rhizobium rhizogenes]